MSSEIKAGDVVRLKSGGPAMTVERVREMDGKVADCAWFSAVGNLAAVQGAIMYAGSSDEGSFYVDALEMFPSATTAAVS